MSGKYPTLEAVEQADREQLCRWHRFLPIARDEEELKVIARVCKRFGDVGGFTPEISKRIGWDQ